MKYKLCLCVLAVAAIAAGCSTTLPPYHYLENWLIREDPVRPFTTHADLIYLQNDLYVDMQNLTLMNHHAKEAVGNGKFTGLARVFSPLVATQEDLEDALDWYFSHYHGKEWPVVFIGEGEGGRLLKAYENAHAKLLAKQGLVASFYTDSAEEGFVTDAMVRDIKNSVLRYRYLKQWGREMPDGMLEE